MRYDSRRSSMGDREYYPDSRSDYRDGPMHFADSRRYDYDDDYPMMDERRRRSSTTGRYMRDRHKQLPEENIERWTRSLMSELEEKDRQLLKMDTLLRRAKEMGITFEKFTEEEFYVTVLMLHTDLAKAFGPNIILDQWIKAAKAWLCDPDAAVRYGKKLAAYYENIVEEDD